MSAFAVIYERSNTPVDPGVFERVMTRLSHRGPDGKDVLRTNHAILGHWHFWTVPEEVGEKQPVAEQGIPYKLVFDGRLDNRAELMAGLKIAPAVGKTFSDAVLILHAYAHWGEQCVEHFLGEYALVLLDESRGELFCARDHLGDRTLFYAWHGTCLVIASEPWAVSGASGASPELDERAVAHYFGLSATEDGQTLFKHVRELLSAHVMVVNTNGLRIRRYWQPDLSRKIRYKKEEEYTEHFLSLLDNAVFCRMRSTTPIGVLMSGGLDSTSVACLAARRLAPDPLTTISVVFDELQDCDEREYIDTVKSQWGISSIQIPCDDTWPYKDWHTWPRNPNQPEGNFYRLSKERVYRNAHDVGLRVVLTGGFADYLYAAGKDWLADLVQDGRFLEAARGINTQIRNKGMRQTLSSVHIRQLAKRFLNMLPGGRPLHRKKVLPAWLTVFSASALSTDATEYQPASELYPAMLGNSVAAGYPREIFNANRHMFDLRHVYRDRNLVEFMMSIPSYQLCYGGLYKRILRSSMRGILPETVRNRYQQTSYVPLLARGVEREKKTLEACLQSPAAQYRKYVRSDWVLKCLDDVMTPDQSGISAEVVWRCLVFETWCKSIF